MRTSAASGSNAPAGVDPGTAHGGSALSGHVVLLIVALSAGVVAQGGYYDAGRILVTVLVMVALAALLRLAPGIRADTWPVVAACAALAGWVLVRAVIADAYPIAFGAVATLAGVAAVLLILSQTSAVERLGCANAMIGLGVLVALTAWIGVAWRVPQFAILVEGRLWRGASTLTYPNAAAALLAPLALLALALLVARPRSMPYAVAAYLLLVGTGATLSRAGLIALAAGLVVLAVTAGVRATISRTGPLLVAAGIAVVLLVPSTPVAAPPQPALAVLGLLAGGLVVTGSVLLPGRIRAGALVATLLSGAVLLLTQRDSEQLGAMLASRGNLESPGRSGALTAALELVAANPLIGTGMGEARFVWLTPNGNGAVAVYAHNEYLQLLVDLGAIGALLLLALFATMALTIRRGSAYQHQPGIRAGVFAALTAFAVHSAFDFLWHIAVLPLVGALLVGLAAPATGGIMSSSNKKEQ
ncbi:O-antigen ligase family protein [Micromonospora sp. NPDC050397]|uniref:O-antigen ligase family protein n=1 Tax=Micromonospora sp. NPDC050397 TaxID=3364279 RepID=UPI00384F9C88